MKKLFERKGFIIIILIIIALLSIFVITPIASSTKTHTKSIVILDNKKMTVMKLTASTALASATLSSLPGDATTPIANQIAKLSFYLMLVIGAIFLEKILLTLTGYMTFTIIIPLACLLFGINLFMKNQSVKKLAIKLCVFGLIIFMVVPISIKVSNIVENTYHDTIEQAVNTTSDAETIAKETEDTSTEVESNGEVENNVWTNVTTKVKEGVSNITNATSNLLKKCETVLSRLIDATAVMIITSCVIPIIVLIAFLWLIKLIFGINFETLKININNSKQ